MKKIIVTGATSMIGSAVVKEALNQGLHVTAIVRKDSKRRSNLLSVNECKSLTVKECDIDNYDNLSFDSNYDAFIHTAWQGTDTASRDDVYLQISNIKYTIDAVRAAHRAGCSVFVDAGSQAEYGCVTEKLSGDTPCNPGSGYGIAKYASGKMMHLTASKLRMRSCHTRILSVYGEGMNEDSVVVYLIKALLAGKKTSLTKCEQLWDYMYVQDAARAFLAIAERGVDGKTYPIGNGVARPLREYFEIIRDIINPHLMLGFGETEYYPHQPMYLCADISELEGDTGFKPTVSFDEGIMNTIEWVKNAHEE